MYKKYNFNVSKFVCQNEKCKDFHKSNNGQVVFKYLGGTKKDTKYLKCKTCGKIFSEKKGTFFYKKHTDKDTIIKALNNTVEGAGIRPTARVFNIDKDTLLSWVKQAGKYANDVEKNFF